VNQTSTVEATSSTTDPARVAPKRSWLRRHPQLIPGLLLLLPAVALLLVFVAYPIGYAVWLSFQDLYLLRGIDSITPYGLGNYRRFFSDPLWTTYVGNTAIWTFGSVIGEVVLGTILALLLNREMLLRGLFRGLVLLPWVMPPVVAAIVWKWILDGQWGILNYVLLNLGLLERPVTWLTDPATMWWSILMISWWKSMPFAFVNVLAGLQAVPGELYEAAQIDGATRWKQFWHITFPLLRPVLAVLILLMTIWRSHEFSLLWVLTQGGPGTSSTTLSIITYKTSFVFFRTSYGASMGVLLMAVILVFTILYMRRVRFDVDGRA
jgi:multiple sugar transport system permease protein